MFKQEQYQIKQSIFLNAVIDAKYGNAKIYKAKKRLELRLKPKNLLDDNFLIAIPTQIPTKEDIYELMQDRYVKSKLGRFLNYGKILKKRKLMNILRPLTKEELNNFFSEHSLKVIQYFMNTSLFAQPEWGADVKMLSCKVDKNDNLTNGDSGETSLAQKFVGTGISLDDMFKNEQYQEIIDGWSSIWKDKLVNVKTNKSIDNIYFFFFLRGSKKESYICAFEVDVDNINIDTITQRDENSKIKQSIFLDGVIDAKYGNSKIYKAKKRLELRLKPKNLLDDGFLITIPTEIPTKEDIYQLVQDKDKFDEYMKNKLTKFLDYSKI